MKKIDTVPPGHIIPDRRKKRERRYSADRREAIRWEPEKVDRRTNRRERRHSKRSPWDFTGKPP